MKTSILSDAHHAQISGGNFFHELKAENFRRVNFLICEITLNVVILEWQIVLPLTI